MLGGTVIYNLLLNNTAITDIVGNNIYPLYIPQEIPLPSITYQLVSTDPNGTKDGVSTLDVERYQVNVYADNFDTMNTLQKLVRTTLDFYTGEVAGLTVQRVWFEGQFTGFSDGSGLTGVYQYSHDYHVRMNPTQTAPTALELTFDNIENVPVNNPYSVSQWNTFFDLPTNGTAFTSVHILLNTVRLIGGSGITITNNLFNNNANLISINDVSNSITTIGLLSFSACASLTSIILPACTFVGIGGFANNPSLVNVSMDALIETEDGGAFTNCEALQELTLPSLEIFGGSTVIGCTSLQVLNLPSCTFVYSASIQSCTSLTTVSIPSCANLGVTVGDDSVFSGVTGKTITLTIPSALMTCNSGQPDGDIQYLQANNTVTIVTV